MSLHWRNLFLENLGQKLFALGLSILIWFTVRSTERLRIMDAAADGSQRFFEVPIVVLTSATDLGRYEVSPSKVQVELRGTPGRLGALQAHSIEAYVNLVDLGKTPQSVHIHVNPPAGTTVILVEPVQVRVDRISENPPPKNLQ